MKQGNLCGKLYQHRNRIITAILLAVLVAICMENVLDVYYNADFYPINGTYQNYNPVRRFLSGQVPVRDFTDYLGLGHLFSGTLVTWLFGGTYTASRMAFQVLSLFSMGMLCYTLGKAVTGNTNVALVFADLAMMLCVWLCEHVAIPDETLQYLLVTVVTGGNSARFIRGLIVPLFCGCLLLGAKEAAFVRKIQLAPKWKNLCGAAVVGLLAGAAFIWSNDHGISCWLCAIVMVVCIGFSRTKKVVPALGYGTAALVSSFIGVFAVVQIISGGHFGTWFQDTFGAGSFQRWYYISEKSFYLWELDYTFFVFVQAALVLVYLVKLYLKGGTKAAVIRFGIPAFANMVCFCAVNEYKLLSGGTAHEFAIAVLLVTVLVEAVQLLVKLPAVQGKKDGLLFLCTGVVVLSGMCHAGMGLKSFWNQRTEYIYSGLEYLEELGGYMYGQADILSTDEFLNGDTAFATYASAQEAYCGYFQPSGVDYIIHVLGDAQRANYLDAFRKGDFRYVSTIRDDTDIDFSLWERWVKPANWFFYRELYRDWHPVFQNGYARYWERNAQPGENILPGETVDLSVEILSDQKVKITLNTDPSVNGTADVFVEYAVKKEDGLMSKLLFNPMVRAAKYHIGVESNPYHNDFGFWFLSQESAEYIPIEISEGYGELYLNSLPEERTYLEVYDAVCAAVFLTAKEPVS